VAGRGSEEICSALLTFFDVSKIRGGNLIAWSDSCTGQNTFFFTVCLWQLLIQQVYFEVIDHKFFEPGHSYLDSDRDFAHVEQAVRNHETVYSVDEYQQIMCERMRKTKFGITRMEDKFYDLKKLPKPLQLKQQVVYVILMETNLNLGTIFDG